MTKGEGELERKIERSRFYLSHYNNLWVLMPYASSSLAKVTVSKIRKIP